MRIEITQHGTTTKLTKPELEKIEQVCQIMGFLARHQPLVPQYKVASDALHQCLAYHGVIIDYGPVDGTDDGVSEAITSGVDLHSERTPSDADGLGGTDDTAVFNDEDGGEPTRIGIDGNQT
jgi:hypothetical protein